VGGEYEVTIDLETLEFKGIWPQGLKSEVMAWIKANRDHLMEEWQRWHP
jgi:hypothetical protein